ncbi:MAG: hypothetical protein K0M45_11585 [Candidatus Paracaedibacteraceae bacterium]|nr:hypothetical protein [Candidatus Paracaedibacteraceae bacterium]
MNKLQLLSAVTLSTMLGHAVEETFTADPMLEDFIIISKEKCCHSNESNLTNLINERLEKEAALIEEVCGRANKKPKSSSATAKPSLAKICYVENYLSDEEKDDEEIRLQEIETSRMEQIHETYNGQIDGYFIKKGTDQTNAPHPARDFHLTEPLKQPSKMTNLLAQLFNFGGESESTATQPPRVEPHVKHLERETAQQAEVKPQLEGPQELSLSIMSSSIMEAISQPQSALIQKESKNTTASQLPRIIEAAIESQPKVAEQYSRVTPPPSQHQTIPSPNKSIIHVQPQTSQQLPVAPQEVRSRSTSTSSQITTSQPHRQAISPRSVPSQITTAAIQQAQVETSRVESQSTSTSSQVTTSQSRPQAISPSSVPSQVVTAATQPAPVKTLRVASQPTSTSSQVTPQQPRPQATSPRGVPSQANSSAIQQARVETSRVGSQPTSTSSQVTIQQPRPQATSPRGVVKQPTSTTVEQPSAMPKNPTPRAIPQLRALRNLQLRLTPMSATQPHHMPSVISSSTLEVPPQPLKVPQ